MNLGEILRSRTYRKEQKRGGLPKVLDVEKEKTASQGWLEGWRNGSKTGRIASEYGKESNRNEDMTMMEGRGKSQGRGKKIGCDG